VRSPLGRSTGVEFPGRLKATGLREGSIGGVSSAISSAAQISYCAAGNPFTMIRLHDGCYPAPRHGFSCNLVWFTRRIC
jgi:hypothetical protein